LAKSKESIITKEIIDKIDGLINRGRIIKVIFIPSNTNFWEIKSTANNNIYYVDLKRNFCSCKGFYFNYIKGKCYHIRAANIAFEQEKYKVVILKDIQLDNYIINHLKNFLM
jgi:predicted nucleic acid-binding Zn finger protein